MRSGRAGSRLARYDLDGLRLVVGRDLDRLALECLGPIETGLLSTGWIQFGWVRLAGRDLDGLALEFLETIATAGCALDRLAACRLETIEMG